ncbi:MAG: N-acetylmuramoyl-L-alanine amidase [Acidobacteria bacterium]|nr:N-acetylmuramoyl-L-alanine amidase [Acidobacteriota bacterium]
MATHIKHRFQFFRWLYFSVIAATLVLMWTGQPARSENFVVYFPNAHSILPLKTYENVRYLPVLKLLKVFGHVARVRSKKKELRVWFESTELQFHQNNRVVRLNKAKLRLSNPPQNIEGEWMVPVDFVTQILPTLINQNVEYQVGENRLFIGNISPNSFTLQMQPMQGGARLTFQFAEPVNLRTAARNGKWILYLGNRPVEPAESNFEFRNAYISRVQYDDQDGHPKLILTPAMAGLDFYPVLGNGEKTLVTEIMKPEVAATAPAPAGPQPAPEPQPAPSQPAAAAAAAKPPTAAPAPTPTTSLLPAVVLDPGHGGSDLGASGGNGLLEKDLTAQIVARVSKALQATGRYQIILTRTGDQTVNFDQRATIANTAHPIAFISFHAGNLGPSTPRVMVYTYQPSSPVALAPGADPRPLFIPWAKVQLGYLNRSQQLAQDLQQDLQKDTGVAGSPPMGVPLRVLRSIAAPAVAIEVGSLAPGSNPAPLTQKSFQDGIAAAVVQALGNFQGGQP